MTIANINLIKAAATARAEDRCRDLTEGWIDVENCPPEVVRDLLTIAREYFAMKDALPPEHRQDSYAANKERIEAIAASVPGPLPESFELLPNHPLQYRFPFFDSSEIKKSQKLLASMVAKTAEMMAEGGAFELPPAALNSLDGKNGHVRFAGKSPQPREIMPPAEHEAMMAKMNAASPTNPVGMAKGADGYYRPAKDGETVTAAFPGFDALSLFVSGSVASAKSLVDNAVKQLGESMGIPARMVSVEWPDDDPAPFVVEAK